MMFGRGTALAHDSGRKLAGGAAVMSPGNECWVEPHTHVSYPREYQQYCRVRETEERWAPRHRMLGPGVDRYLWEWWQQSAGGETEVVMSFRSATSPRVRRLVGEVLRSIARGRPASQAIRLVARRFGLRQGQARAFIAAGISYEVRRPVERLAPGGPVTCSALFYA